MSQSLDRADLELALHVPPSPDAAVPGRITFSSLLTAPRSPIASGLIQRKARDTAGVAEGAEDAVVAAASSAGSPLPSELRARFEASLGSELAGVRIHTGAESARASAAVGARAYTLGNDIHFAAGHFDPASLAGQHLLAHEVVHTLQQRGGAPHRQHKLEVSSPGDALEHEADRAAEAMVAGTPFGLSGAAGGPAGRLHRQQDPSAGAGQGVSVPSLGASASPSGQQLSSTGWTLQGFATDSDALTPDHQQIIAQIANDLNTNGLGYNGFVTITGHADSRGTETHNQQLGQQRADRVRASLNALLADPQTAQQVHSYSTGELDNERSGDVAEYRQVTVSVTRRPFPVSGQPTDGQPPPIPSQFSLPVPAASPGPEGPKADSAPAPDWQLVLSGGGQIAWHVTFVGATGAPKDVTLQIQIAENHAMHPPNQSGMELQGMIQFGYNRTTHQVTISGGAQGTEVLALFHGLLQVGAFAQILAGVAESHGSVSGQIQPAIGGQATVQAGSLQVGASVSPGMTIGIGGGGGITGDLGVSGGVGYSF